MKSTSDNQPELFSTATLSPVAPKPMAEENVSFAQAIKNVMDERGYKNFEAAQLVRQTTRTIQRWKAGKTVPEKSVRDHALKALSDPKNQPSSRMVKEMDRLHNLTWDASKKRWKLRITIDRGPKVVGYRVSQDLRKKDPETAIAIREAIIDFSGKLKLKVKPRIQKRKG